MATMSEPMLSARRRAALPGSGWDRLVTVVKIVLPLLAAMLLATIVIWPLTSVQEFSFLLSKDKVEMSKERLRTDRALYRGETARGQSFEIRAAGAVQRSSAVPIVELSALAADLNMTEGLARVTAPGGRYEIDNDLLVISGPVKLDSAAGYTLNGADVRISLIRRTVTTDLPVTGTLPLGTFRANNLRADVSGRRVQLGGGTHLHIVPGSRTRSPS